MSNGIIERDKINNILTAIKTKTNNSSNSLTVDNGIELLENYAPTTKSIGFTYWKPTSSSDASKYITSFYVSDSSIFKYNKPFVGFIKYKYAGSIQYMTMFKYDGAGTYTYENNTHISSISIPASNRITFNFSSQIQKDPSGSTSNWYLIVFYTY